MTLKKTLTVSLVCIVMSGAAFAKSVGNTRYASLVVDGKNGMILTETNAGEYRYPASLTKMMTLYMAFSALEQGTLQENQLLPVSAYAAGQSRTKLGLRTGDKIPVKDVILSLVTISANDGAVVLAEAIGGTEPKFAKLMTSTAGKLGMSHSTFMNASGLHHPKQRTTAYDMARLAVALRRDFPQYYPLFSRESFIYKGTTYRSHNHVNRKYQGADGIKTGFIGASGYNLVTSVVRNGKSLVGVVFGGQTFKRRDDNMMSLLDQSFYRLAKGVPTGQAYAIKMPNSMNTTKASADTVKSTATVASSVPLPASVAEPAATPAAIPAETVKSTPAVELAPYVANAPPPPPVVSAFTVAGLDQTEHETAVVPVTPTVTKVAKSTVKPKAKIKPKHKAKTHRKKTPAKKAVKKTNPPKSVPVASDQTVDAVPVPTLKP